jgi:hypothetical protein
MDQIQLDGGVLLFTTIVSIGVALAFGLLPAPTHRDRIFASNAGVIGGTRTFRPETLSGLVVVEVALALVLSWAPG